MKIILNKADEAKLIKLLETKEENIAVASMFNDLCFSLDQFHDLDKASKGNLDETFKNIFYDYFELDESNVDNKRIIDTYVRGSLTLLETKEYENNLYKKTVYIKNISQNGYKFHYLSYPSYSIFPLDDIRVNEKDNYREYTSLGYFKNDYQYLTLSKNNNIWMCITPNEINTMKPHLDKAKGNVITFGLGLGYFAFMAVQKENVKKVTIVERDIEVINLFNQHLLPLFTNANKIEIIHDDAFNYIKKNRLINYDYAFFDLWHNAEDGLTLYIEAKSMNIACPTGYWIEESLIALYRRCLLTVIEESLAHYSDDDYRQSKNAIDKIINQIYFKTKNLRFNSFNDIYSFLSNDNILKLISK